MKNSKPQFDRSSQREDVNAVYATPSEARQLLKTGDAGLRRLEKTDPTFPRVIRISSRKRLYRVDELIAWAESRREKALPAVVQKRKAGAR